MPINIKKNYTKEKKKTYKKIKLKQNSTLTVVIQKECKTN